MRINVECGGYAEAAGVCQTANHIAALLSESLARKLEAYAGMAGDDATSSEFAASYDPVALDAIATLSDLTHALIGLGRLIDGSGRNHSAAEAASGGLATNAYSGGGLDEDSFARVALLSPPSSLGGRTTSGLGDIQDWILDQVEGFIWPGADAARLRDAAAVWRRTSGSVFDLTAHLDVVGSLLERQRSGEIPLALAAISELRGLVVTTSEELTELATACDDYATAVDDTRELTRSLLAEVGRMIVEETVVTVIVAGLTGGLGGTAKAGAAVLRIRAQAPRFHALLTSLRAVIAGASVRMRAAEDSLQRARAGFERYARASVRDERGELRNPLGWGGSGIDDLTRSRGWLRAHEVPPGHTVTRHVGKSVDELEQRLVDEGKKRVSTFTDEMSAERLIGEAITERQSAIEAWLRSGSKDTLVIDVDLAKLTGTSLSSAGDLTTCTSVRAVLIPEGSDGWQLLTAYPR